ncbi:MAG TPA: 1,6-anhydro-N-acetylmuramyl-L-alanine amidase AmpD [Thiopseudomonas sp.]|nr:1,6-anhydro-N-acetylmuramyl-L-alanine amidase AmpD [Thiopseudomonas sp.]
MQHSQSLTLNTSTGWLNGATHLPSANHNARPNAEISLLVIHNISLPPGEFGTGMVEALFTNRLPVDAHPYFADIAHLKVSAHFFIKRSGAITQFVSCLDRAWHAGVSDFKGREACNDFSLGIELEGEDHLAYSDAQYHSLNRLVTELSQHYPMITAERICGHSDIAPERKTDPGPAFDWQRLNAKYTGETL